MSEHRDPVSDEEWAHYHDADEIDWQRAFYEVFDELRHQTGTDYQSIDFDEPNAKAAVVHYWDNFDPTP